MTDDDRDHLRARGIGITNVVRRATARADELTDDELRAGGARARRRRSSGVRRRGSSRSPASRRTAPPSAAGRPRSAGRTSRSAAPSCGSCPNPSGLNAHETVHSLAMAYAEAARAAGVIS